VLCRRRGDLEAARLRGLPPSELHHVAKPARLEIRPVAQRRHDLARRTLLQPAQRGQVHVVVVVVTHQDDIDVREVVERYAGGVDAGRAGPLHRAHAK
jgi:hypothetical protein